MRGDGQEAALLAGPCAMATLLSLSTSVSGLARVQLHRPGSLLKFIPEEILIHGRDFRLLRVGFEAGGLEPQAFQVRGPLDPWDPFPGPSQCSPLSRGLCCFPQGEVEGWDK